MIRVWFQRLSFVLVLMCVGGHVLAADVTPQQNGQTVVERVRPRADQGNANAQYNMGVIYDRGYGVQRDYQKALKWYKKAAAQGYAKAAHNLGVMYQKGHGVPIDSEKAAHWFKKAAELGEPAAQNNLAVMYARGQGVERNMRLAAVWAARAAQAGNSSAVANLPLIIEGLPEAAINGDNVNIRSQPTTDSVVVKQSGSGVEVVVLEQRGDWTRVLFPADYVLGWVADFLLQGVGTAAAAVATGQGTAVGTGEVSDAVVTEEAGDTMMATEAGTGGSGTTSVAGSDEENGPAAIATETTASGSDTASDAAAADASAAQVRKAIGADTVNVREQPSTASAVLFQAHRGDRVTILKEQYGWNYVKFDDGRTGWVAGYLLVDV